MIFLYRFLLSPFLPNRCRFYPTCSAYGQEAFEKHGFLKGFYMTFKRLSRCHPWGGEGIDLVPETPKNQHNRIKNGSKR